MVFNKGISKGVNAVDRHTINTNDKAGIIAKDMFDGRSQERIRENLAEMERNGYTSTYRDRARVIWRSMERENRGVVWK